MCQKSIPMEVQERAFRTKNDSGGHLRGPLASKTPPMPRVRFQDLPPSAKFVPLWTWFAWNSDTYFRQFPTVCRGHGGGVGPQGPWIYLFYIYIYICIFVYTYLYIYPPPCRQARQGVFEALSDGLMSDVGLCLSVFKGPTACYSCYPRSRFGTLFWILFFDAFLEPNGYPQEPKIAQNPKKLCSRGLPESTLKKDTKK